MLVWAFNDNLERLLTSLEVRWTCGIVFYFRGHLMEMQEYFYIFVGFGGKCQIVFYTCVSVGWDCESFYICVGVDWKDHSLFILVWTLDDSVTVL